MPIIKILSLLHAQVSHKVGTEVLPSQLQNLTFRRDKKLRKLTNKDPAMGQTLKKAFDP